MANGTIFDDRMYILAVSDSSISFFLRHDGSTLVVSCVFVVAHANKKSDSAIGNQGLSLPHLLDMTFMKEICIFTGSVRGGMTGRG